MAKAPSTGPHHKPLYDAVTSKLTPAQTRRLEEIFAGLEIEEDGQRYRIGHIMKAAWQAEDALPAAAAREIAELVRAVLDAAVSHYPAPACCRWHRLMVPAAFADPRHYPPDSELLANLSQLIWTLLPHLRGAISLNHPRRRLSSSRFMMFENFVKWHDREVIVGGRLLADAVLDYERAFSPSRSRTLRRAELRKRLVADEICGMIGARNDNPPGGGVPHYCDKRWPFSTPSLPDSRARVDPPDRELRRLGLQFGRRQRYIELLYPVEIGHQRSSAQPGAALPSIVDAEGYWLFRPDRATGRDGRRWNHARNLENNKRGRRELIARPGPITHLVDLIVWPRPTVGSWTTGAAPQLAADNVV